MVLGKLKSLNQQALYVTSPAMTYANWNQVPPPPGLTNYQRSKDYKPLVHPLLIQRYTSWGKGCTKPFFGMDKEFGRWQNGSSCGPTYALSRYSIHERQANQPRYGTSNMPITIWNGENDVLPNLYPLQFKKTSMIDYMK